MRNLNLYLKVKNFAGLIKLFIKVGVLFQGILVFIREGEWDGGSEAFFQYFYNGNLSMGMGGGGPDPKTFLSVLGRIHFGTQACFHLAQTSKITVIEILHSLRRTNLFIYNVFYPPTFWICCKHRRGK